MTLITEPAATEEGLGEFQTRDECRCEACKIVNPVYGDRTKLTPARVHNYSYKPRTWNPKAAKDDPDLYFFGVELETDNYVSGGARDRFGRMTYRQDSMVSNAYAAAMRNPKNLWLPKTDASVTGPEFVSHPATLKYWMQHRAALKKMFVMLLHAGFRSHDNDNAGMHINISKVAFDDADHLYKFITLVHFSPVWARRMAQRTQSSMEAWAKVDMGGNKQLRRELSLWAMKTNGIDPYLYVADIDGTSFWRHNQTVPNPAYTSLRRPYVDRYTAINIPEGESRMEFRLPRGTLRVDRFMKNLQWTHGMIEYTRTCGVAAARPAAFMDWAMDNKRKYPDLAAFLVERAPRLRTAVR